MATRTVEVVTEIVRGALEAGVTIATLITETIANPSQAMENLMAGAARSGNHHG